MFLRQKKAGERVYLQIVENRRENGHPRQRVIATLGRLDQLQRSGHLEGLLQSAARFSNALLLVDKHRAGELPTIATRRIGPPLVFERVWLETGCRAVINALARPRKFRFRLERAIFLTVLHRLVAPGSDRAAEKWKDDYRLAGVEALELHQLYRAMAWLGEELAPGEQHGRSPFAPRTTKDLVEEKLFARRRDLFSSLDLVFFDTTSIYFEGEGGETIGDYGNSKDHRPDLKQMVVGVVLDDRGMPICCEVWPGNTSDVTTLIHIVDRLRERFGIRRICVVADRGMISKKTIALLESEEYDLDYILGARMRQDKEVRDQVLGRPGRYHKVHPKRQHRDDPSPLKVKEVWVEERRYIVCLNEDEARRDAAGREAIVAALREKLRQGDKSLVGNKGFRTYLKTPGDGHFEVDDDKLQEETRYDGKWVLRARPRLKLSAEELALKYKQLWTVEHLIRAIKSVLRTRPIYHKCDDTIRGHVFCSFLGLVLRKELKDRLAAAGDNLEWADVVRDLDVLTEVEIEQGGKRFFLRSEAKGTCGKVFHAVGVALPPTVRQQQAQQLETQPKPRA